MKDWANICNTCRFLPTYQAGSVKTYSVTLDDKKGSSRQVQGLRVWEFTVREKDWAQL